MSGQIEKTKFNAERTNKNIEHYREVGQVSQTSRVWEF